MPLVGWQALSIHNMIGALAYYDIIWAWLVVDIKALPFIFINQKSSFILF